MRMRPGERRRRQARTPGSNRCLFLAKGAAAGSSTENERNGDAGCLAKAEATGRPAGRERAEASARMV
jgi:hypothetical protein